MMSSQQPKSQWLTAALSISITLALLSITASSSTVTSILYFWRSKTDSNSKADAKKKKIQELEASLKQALKNCAAERQGRIRAQQDLRDALSRSELYDSVTYPMPPIGVIKSCFSTRNGTPRQPLLVPQARATLTFDPKRVPPASLEGLEGYSHCWIIFVFHLNTNLEKLWKNPSQSRYKAKVRIPGLNGDKMGLFATRSPHRPCPIGLTVAKVESVCGHHVLLSGADLVDGTPVLDIKPYLPYCDNIPGATVPDWVKADNVLVVSSVDFTEGFSSSLADCWPLLEKRSLYATPDEFKLLIKQVLSWDIRSTPQRNRPHKPQTEAEDVSEDEETIIVDKPVGNGGKLVYHLTLENLDVWYKIDSNANVLVENITPMPQLCESENGSVANC